MTSQSKEALEHVFLIYCVTKWEKTNETLLQYIGVSRLYQEKAFIRLFKLQAELGAFSM